MSSRVIFESIIRHERQDSHGLNGFLLLLHFGAGPGRTDKFHTRFGELLDDLAGKGYQFVCLGELLEPSRKSGRVWSSPACRGKTHEHLARVIRASSSVH